MAKPTTLRSPVLAVAVAACGLAFIGCRAVDNAQVDVMERELRQQQAYIYELEDYLMQYSDKLRDCRTCQAETVVETKSTRSQSRRPQPTLADDSQIEPLPQRSRPQSTPPRTTTPTPPASDAAPDVFDEAAPPVEAEPPAAEPNATPETLPTDAEGFELEIGPTSSRRRDSAAALAVGEPADDAPLFIPDPTDYVVDETSVESVAQADVAAAVVDAEVAETAQAPALAEPMLEPHAEEQVADAAPVLPPPADPARLIAQQLKIRYVLAGSGEASDEAPRSLMVVVEAVNATDEPVDANGEASLMVTRGETRETLRPIERWDFTADETQAAWQSSQLGDGLHLELPLTGALPEEPVYLWVRLVTPDGQNLRTRVPFALGELATLDAALAAADAGKREAPQVAAAEDAAEQAPEAIAAKAAAPAAPTTNWRASTQPVGVTPTGGLASSAVGGANGWTAQPPGGRAPGAAVPRVAAATMSDAPPRWQQGSAEPPANEPAGAWTTAR
jgi:hypothetical protein